MASASWFFTGAPVHDVAHRELGDLAGLGARDVGDRDDLRRHVARRWRRCGSWRRIRCVERRRRASTPSRSRTNSTTRTSSSQSWPMTSALDHLRQLLDLAVDLGRADAHAAGIERRVGAAVDDHAAVLGPLGEVAVAPDVGEALEVGGAVFLAVGIVPEADRHRRERRGADELALLAAHRLAVVVEDVDRHAEAAALDLAAPHRLRSGSPSTKQETMSVPPEIEARCTSLLDRRRRRSRSSPATAASRSRRSCARVDRSCVSRGSRPALRTASMNLAEVPKMRHPLGLGEVEQHVAVGMERRAVVEQQRRAGREARDQPVPHHPAAGREVEEPVAARRCRQCSRCSFRCWSSVPPAPCTMHFGTPVVPDEYRM